MIDFSFAFDERMTRPFPKKSHSEVKPNQSNQGLLLSHKKGLALYKIFISFDLLILITNPQRV